jgi:glycine cleavage system H lipoate-binding protein
MGKEFLMYHPQLLYIKQHKMLNGDPHGESRLIQLGLADRSEIDKLMTAVEYEAYFRQEKAHY